MQGKLAVAFLSIFDEFLTFTDRFHLLLKKYDSTKLIFLIITDKERESTSTASHVVSKLKLF